MSAGADSEKPSSQLGDMGLPVSELPWSADFVMQSIEILPVALGKGRLISLRPDCADSFLIGWPAGRKPEEVAARAIESLGFRPVVLHSTSWRHAETEVVLTYLAVVAADYALPDSWETAPVTRAELARGDTTTPPAAITAGQVLEHALRHLAWLHGEDEAVTRALPGWSDCLRVYSAEPFRALNTPDLQQA